LKRRFTLPIFKPSLLKGSAMLEFLGFVAILVVFVAVTAAADAIFG